MTSDRLIWIVVLSLLIVLLLKRSNVRVSAAIGAPSSTRCGGCRTGCGTDRSLYGPIRGDFGDYTQGNAAIVDAPPGVFVTDDVWQSYAAPTFGTRPIRGNYGNYRQGRRVS